VATEGMLGDLNPLGDGPCRSLADHGARVPEVLPAAELEGFLAGLIIAMPRELYGASVVDDVEEAQEFAVEASAGGDYAGQEGVFESGMSGPVAVHLGASGALEDPAGLRVAEGPVSAHVSQMISTEFVVNCDIEDQVAVAAEVDVLELQVSPTHLARWEHSGFKFGMLMDTVQGWVDEPLSAAQLQSEDEGGEDEDGEERKSGFFDFCRGVRVQVLQLRRDSLASKEPIASPVFEWAASTSKQETRARKSKQWTKDPSNRTVMGGLQKRLPHPPWSP
jgi:hypothetical protein